MAETAAIELTVSEFVAVLNQTMEFAFPSVVIHGELANFRVSKNRWVYFDLKDESASVKFFGTVYNLPGPLEDGMLMSVRGQPRLHQLYGFSVTVLSMQPVGEGSIRRAADLLQIKLMKEGLFDAERKRALPYPPSRIGLVTSSQSAAYADFIKVLDARWRGLHIQLVDVQVQGEIAPAQIVRAIETLNSLAEPPEVVILIRGGGSAEDLAAFSTEVVTRAVAASRVPTLVAIGHEIDLSLAELAADKRASTPSNAAELLVPDRLQVSRQLGDYRRQLTTQGRNLLAAAQRNLEDMRTDLDARLAQLLMQKKQRLGAQQQLLAAFNPEAILRRGYALVRTSGGQVIRSTKQVSEGGIVNVQLADGTFSARRQPSGKA